MPGNGCYRACGKRTFDVIASATGLILLSPLFLIIAAAIKLHDNGPVFYKQQRIGRYFKPFLLIKFRTMRTDSGGSGAQITVQGDPRVTKTGSFLRKTKLDEIPQMINVLRGDMSIVGPRPEVGRYVEMFRGEYERILTIRPGITDYAAVEFRNEEAVLREFDDPESGYIGTVLPRKIEHYNRYLCDAGFATDIRLIFQTFCKIAS
jgi:lipopolysaccharide/colanic/teichoic acid biosynthesis glycosyltransferase